jgi:hypothetical protein
MLWFLIYVAQHGFRYSTYFKETQNLPSMFYIVEKRPHGLLRVLHLRHAALLPRKSRAAAFWQSITLEELDVGHVGSTYLEYRLKHM